MIACDCTWLHVIAYECMWLHVIACDCMWLHVIAYECMWLHMIACDCIWMHVIACDCSRSSTKDGRRWHEWRIQTTLRHRQGSGSRQKATPDRTQANHTSQWKLTTRRNQPMAQLQRIQLQVNTSHRIIKKLKCPPMKDLYHSCQPSSRVPTLVYRGGIEIFKIISDYDGIYDE